jgi:hypothetical protein
MDVVLIILGILGFGAIMISAYIFTVAARNYVSDDLRKDSSNTRTARHQTVTRSPSDRRGGQAVTFPLTVNGMLITHDRRHTPERRRAA